LILFTLFQDLPKEIYTIQNIALIQGEFQAVLHNLT